MNELAADKPDGTFLRQALVLTQEAQIFEVTDTSTTISDAEQQAFILSNIASNIICQWDHKTLISKINGPTVSTLENF